MWACPILCPFLILYLFCATSKYIIIYPIDHTYKLAHFLKQTSRIFFLFCLYCYQEELIFTQHQVYLLQIIRHVKIDDTNTYLPFRVFLSMFCLSLLMFLFIF